MTFKEWLVKEKGFTQYAVDAFGYAVRSNETLVKEYLGYQAKTSNRF